MSFRVHYNTIQFTSVNTRYTLQDMMYSSVQYNTARLQSNTHNTSHHSAYIAMQYIMVCHSTLRDSDVLCCATRGSISQGSTCLVPILQYGHMID